MISGVCTVVVHARDNPIPVEFEYVRDDGGTVHVLDLWVDPKHFMELTFEEIEEFLNLAKGRLERGIK